MRSRVEPLKVAILCLVAMLGMLAGTGVSAATSSEVAGFTYDGSFDFAQSR